MVVRKINSGLGFKGHELVVSFTGLTSFYHDRRTYITGLVAPEKYFSYLHKFGP